VSQEIETYLTHLAGQNDVADGGQGMTGDTGLAF
jgi:hypothetical protein